MLRAGMHLQESKCLSIDFSIHFCACVCQTHFPVLCQCFTYTYVPYYMSTQLYRLHHLYHTSSSSFTNCTSCTAPVSPVVPYQFYQCQKCTKPSAPKKTTQIWQKTAPILQKTMQFLQKTRQTFRCNTVSAKIRCSTVVQYVWYTWCGTVGTLGAVQMIHSVQRRWYSWRNTSTNYTSSTVRCAQLMQASLFMTIFST